jgi:hypothetical protein
MQVCWSILLGLCMQVQSRSGRVPCIEGAVLLNLLLLLHGTWGNDNTCGVGLNTPGGEYDIVH